MFTPKPRRKLKRDEEIDKPSDSEENSFFFLGHGKKIFSRESHRLGVARHKSCDSLGTNLITCGRLTSSICGDLKFSRPYCSRPFCSPPAARCCRISPWFWLIFDSRLHIAHVKRLRLALPSHFDVQIRKVLLFHYQRIWKSFHPPISNEEQVPRDYEALVFVDCALDSR